MRTNADLENIIEIFKEYQKVPNAPFLTKFTSKFIRHYLDKNNVEYSENPYSIIVHAPSKESVNNKRKIIFMSHMDHPGIVLKNNQDGIMMGLNDPRKFSESVDNNPQTIVVFDQEGNFLGKSKLVKLKNDSKQRVKIKADFDVPKNSFGHFDVPRFSENTDKIFAYNADDGIMVGIMIDLIIKRPESDYDVYYVFNKHEEVFQVSAWNMAKNNSLHISDRDIIVNLECLKTESINPEKYPVIDYDKGPVLQLSNIGCLFGYKNPGTNFAEILVRTLADENSIPLQIGLINDSCDSRPFTEFATTPNICTITIPNKFKHDGADDGKILPEEIYKRDIEHVAILLEKIILSNPKTLRDSAFESLSEKIKGADDVTDLNLMKFKTGVNNRIDIAYKHIVRRGYFYPSKPFDYIADFILKILSYISYTVSKIR